MPVKNNRTFGDRMKNENKGKIVESLTNLDYVLDFSPPRVLGEKELNSIRKVLDSTESPQWMCEFGSKTSISLARRVVLERVTWMKTKPEIFALHKTGHFSFALT